MNKLSDMFNLLDKSSECYNFFIDMDNQYISQEIKWLNDNYENTYLLRAYFLRFATSQNFLVYMHYLDYLNSLSDSDIQLIAQNRANVLYSHIKYNKQHKIENIPIKLIAEELKKINL